MRVLIPFFVYLLGYLGVMTFFFLTGIYYPLNDWVYERGTAALLYGAAAALVFTIWRPAKIHTSFLPGAVAGLLGLYFRMVIIQIDIALTLSESVPLYQLLRVPIVALLALLVPFLWGMEACAIVFGGLGGVVVFIIFDLMANKRLELRPTSRPNST